MDRQDFDELGQLGDQIKDIVDRAVKSRDYQQMSQEIKKTVNKAVDTGRDALKDALNSAFGNGQGGSYENRTKAFEERRRQERIREEQQRQKEEKEAELMTLYDKPTGMKVKGILQTVFGGILTGFVGASFLGFLIAAAVGVGGGVIATGTVITGAGTLIGAGLLTGGCRNLCRVSRFNKYLKALGQHTYCNFQQLSAAVRKPVKYVKKDIKTMISKGWFLQGHIDGQETCLITSNETYSQYVETQKQLEMKQQEEKLRKEQQEAARERLAPDVQEVLQRGNEYLEKIKKSNDAIPGEEISNKISRMELIVQKIFERAQEHPEVIPDLKRLMSYYLPMTVKLLDAYEDMDSQPVQGENIRTSKKEIEDTLDTLNAAFEKLLDSIFQDTAWDVSTDISVLHTMLAQEGLKEDDLVKM